MTEETMKKACEIASKKVNLKITLNTIKEALDCVLKSDNYISHIGIGEIRGTALYSYVSLKNNEVREFLTELLNRREKELKELEEQLEQL